MKKLLTITFILCSIAAAGQRINYTVDANGVHIQGVDQSNPVIYDNDMIYDTPEGFYIFLKANRKEINLVGVVSSNNPHAQAQQSEKQPALFQQFTSFYNSFRSIGGMNVPAPVLGSLNNLPSSGFENSAGSDLIISEARKASASKPLVIFCGGQSTTVANAVRKDNSIKDKIVVFHIGGYGSFNNMNAIDANACLYLIDTGVKYITWTGDNNSWYDQAGSPQYRGAYNPPINRMPGITFTTINNAFAQSYKSNFEHMYHAYGSTGDGPSVFYFFNHSLWRNMVRKNRSNQTVTDNSFAFLTVTANNWTQYGPQLSAYMNNAQNYIPVTTPIPPVNQPPLVALTLSGTSFTEGNILLTANASDTDGSIFRVEFFANGNKVGETSVSPYSYSWSASQGMYAITARATDNAGASTTSAQVVITVTPTNPGPGPSPLPGDVNVLDMGAKGDGVTDDTPAFQAAINKVGYRGRLIVPPPSNFYKITNTITVSHPNNQVFMDVEAWGWGNGTNAIRYMGPSNRPVFKIVGLKSAVWTGVKVGIQDGITGVQVFDIDTTPSAGSTSFVTFKNFYINLGNGQNNDGFRLGHLSGGGADVSNYQWENCIVFGGGKLGSAGKVEAIPGQIAYHIEGRNTLSQTWMGGFVAGCDRIFSNKSGAGANVDRGNGSVFFFGLGSSQNNIDYDINFEQNYLMIGGRYESSNQVLTTVAHSFHAAITFQSIQFNDYKGDHLFDVNTAATLVIDNCRMNKKSGTLQDLVRCSAQSGAGTIDIRTGGTNAVNLIRQDGGGTFRKYAYGVGRFSDINGVFIGTHYLDQNGQ